MSILGLFVFVSACMLLQALKDLVRGKARKRPTVSLAQSVVDGTATLETGKYHAIAMCGCELTAGDNGNGTKVKRPCEAHRAMMDS